MGGPETSLVLLLLGITLLASSNTYQLLALGGRLRRVIDWDDPQNLEQVKESVRQLLRGCGCKIGCNTKRCSCCKATHKCGPGCRCSNCQNVPGVQYFSD